MRFSFAASSTLARQIESGAPAELFLSADREWMDYLEQRGLIDRSTRRDLLGNRLALIAPADSTVSLKIEPNFPLAAALGGGRLATGDPDNVPVGRYARSALTSLGVWNEVADRLMRARRRSHGACIRRARRGAARHRLRDRRPQSKRKCGSSACSRKVRIRASRTRWR